MLPRPKNCHFQPSFRSSFGYFAKFKKECGGLIRLRLKDESIIIDIVSQLNVFLDISWGVTPFCKNKVGQN